MTDFVIVLGAISGLCLAWELEAERGKEKIENKDNGFEEVFAKYRHPKVDTTQNTEYSYIDTIMYLYEQRKKIKCVNE